MDYIIGIIAGIFQFLFEFCGQFAGFIFLILLGLIFVPILIKIEQKISSFPKWLEVVSIVLYFVIGGVIIIMFY